MVAEKILIGYLSKTIMILQKTGGGNDYQIMIASSPLKNKK